MLAENSHHVQSGHLDREIHLPSTAKHELVDFISEQLPLWRDHPDRPDKQSETALTEYLCDHLNSAVYHSETWSHVQFRTETGDETHAGRKIDLTVKPRAASLIIEGRRHSQFDPLFPIECKRLPTPKEKDRDEREYVITEPGTTGGMQRFKFGHHGAAHDFVAMIAFVQEYDFQHWHGKLNGWISDLTQVPNSSWKLDEVLHVVDVSKKSKICSLASTLQRLGKLNDCEVRHLWVQMN
ncbi:MAG: hypothetical protein Q8Q59_11790 [Luteolibacter sp.]|jgi:hypothetical protein|nr:hypothetical protein [Luteolibacter sp.]